MPKGVKKKPLKLDQRSARLDLTDRECTKLIGGQIGVLLEMADPVDVYRAIKWWEENFHQVAATMAPLTNPERK